MLKSKLQARKVDSRLHAQQSKLLASSPMADAAIHAAAAVATAAAAAGAVAPVVGAEAAFAALGALGAAQAGEVDELLERQRQLLQQKKVLAKELKLKKARDNRLLNKAVKHLSKDQLMQAAALKTNADAKAKAKVQAKVRAVAKAQAAAHLG